MKNLKIILLTALLVAGFTVWSQVAINMDESNPDQSAMLDVKSTELGFLMPRMTSAQRIAIFLPATGLTVYDTDLLGFSYYNGSNWVTIGAGMDSDWVINGNNMYSGVNGNIGIGTDNPQTGLHISKAPQQLRGQLSLSDPIGDDIAITFYEGISYKSYIGHTDGMAVWATDDGSNLIIGNTNSGNVGIGTTTPDQKLTVDNGNALIKGGDGWNSNGDEAQLFLGHPEHSITSIYSQGIRVRTNPGSDHDIRFGGSNGEDYMTVKMTSGNVGIGTTTPTRKLHIVSSTSDYGMVRLQNENPGQNEASIAFLEGSDVASTDMWVMGVGSWGNPGDFVIGRGNVKLKLDNNGRVGIGTTNPSVMLDVAGAINLNKDIPAGVALRINDLPIIERYGGFVQWGGADNSYFPNKVGIGTFVTTTLLDIRSDQSFIGGDIICGNNDLSDYLKFTSGQSFDHNPFIQWQDGGSLRFATDLGGLSEKMRISSNGNVGIGVTNPSVNLEVRSKATTDAGCFVIGNSDLSSKIKLWSGDQSNPHPFMQWKDGGSFVFATDQGGWSEKIRIASNGNVGIGVTNPASSLDVNGNITIRDGASNIVVELGTGLDYAEGFDLSNNVIAQPGMVLILDEDNPGELKLSNISYDSKVAGIVAGANNLGSGIKLGSGQFDCNVALAGRVYCNVDATYGKVSVGDLLTTSNTPGHAMVMEDRSKAHGTILGKAMQGLEKGKKGQILVLVTLQ